MSVMWPLLCALGCDVLGVSVPAGRKRGGNGPNHFQTRPNWSSHTSGAVGAGHKQAWPALRGIAVSLPPLNSVERCPKCGCPTFVRGWCGVLPPALMEYVEDDDWIRRTCRRCGFIWFEEPISINKK